MIKEKNSFARRIYELISADNEENAETKFKEFCWIGNMQRNTSVKKEKSTW